MGPRYLVRSAGLEMHPIDQADRREYLKESGGIGYCNITKCCTDVCPEHIRITDNAIIPLKERVADRYYDPLQWAWRKLRGGGSGTGSDGRAAGPPGRSAPPAAGTRPGGAIERAVLPGARGGAEGGRTPAAARPRGFVIRTDGAARGNPGPGLVGCGAVRPRAPRRPR